MPEESQAPIEPKRGDYAREKGEIVLRKHEYDGIQEYDQKLPNWWLFTLYAAIVFFIAFWLVYYHSDLMATDQQNVTSAMTEIQKKKKAALEATLASLDDSILVNQWATDTEIVTEGQAIYQQVCIGCHGPELDAPLKLGLSLVDHEWKYGARPLDIFKIINEGTPADSTGMPPSNARMQAWGQVYTPKQIAQLTAFIISKIPEDFKEF